MRDQGQAQNLEKGLRPATQTPLESYRLPNLTSSPIPHPTKKLPNPKEGSQPSVLERLRAHPHSKGGTNQPILCDICYESSPCKGRQTSNTLKHPLDHRCRMARATAPCTPHCPDPQPSTGLWPQPGKQKQQNTPIQHRARRVTPDPKHPAGTHTTPVFLCKDK